ncbi:MAG: hypothetical protein DMG06_23115 [Acidobacteria bacterium]|nr:MAG: hypothetical protein DMG06_23115 [Acidobacteriota bacterium]
MDETHGWVLKVGGIRAIDPELVRPAYERLGLFRTAFNQCEQELAQMTDTREPLQGVRTNRPIGAEYQKSFDFAVLYALSRQFMVLAATPELIGTDLAGQHVALCLSGMMSISQALRMLLEPESASQLILERPRVPFYDPVHEKILQPFRLSPDYLNSLVNQTTLDHPFPQPLVDQAKLLANSQYSFKNIWMSGMNVLVWKASTFIKC